MLGVKHGPAAATEAYIVTTVFVRAGRSASWRVAESPVFIRQERGRLTGTGVCQHGHISQGVGTGERMPGACLCPFAALVLR